MQNPIWKKLLYLLGMLAVLALFTACGPADAAVKNAAEN